MDNPVLSSVPTSDSASSSPAGVRTLAVLQPGYLPWLGFFDQMLRSDVFVLYDDVQYDKNGWRNRNRIKSVTSQPHWLTVPVHVHLGQRILDVEIDMCAPWAGKQLATIRQFYRKAPYFMEYFPVLEELLMRKWERLVDLDIVLIDQIRDWLDIRTEMLRASELPVSGDRNQRLINICAHLHATHYLSGNAAQSYLDVSSFTHHGITVGWQDYEHPEYSQVNGGFVPYLSVIDLLFNCGHGSREIISNRERLSK